ncbi:MAG: HPP family protein [Dehalococcoidia bacterium]
MWFRFQVLDPKLKSNIRPYIYQCSLAFFALLLVLLVEEVGLQRAVIIAAIGSTSFVLFVTPHASTANPRHVIGGHLIALFIGSSFAAFDGTTVGQSLLAHTSLAFDVEAALAVALSIFFMAATDTEHAPAAGTALGVVAHDFSWGLVLFVISSVIMLSLAHAIVRPRLRNLQ